MRCTLLVPLISVGSYLLLCGLRYYLDPETPLSTSFPSADSIVTQAIDKGAVVENRQVLVTGSNTGIGFDCARVFAKHGANVVASARNERKGVEAVDHMNAANSNGKRGKDAAFGKLDLSSFDSIEAFVDGVEQGFDVLVLNAAVLVFHYAETHEGIELLWGVNHIGHFYLVELLLKQGKVNPGAVIILVSSIGHRTFMDAESFDSLRYPLNRSTFNFVEAYGVSKLANNLHALALSRLTGDNVREGLFAFAVHPGMVRTEFGKLRGCEEKANVLNRIACKLNTLSQKLWWTVLPFTLSTSEGAANVIFPALMPAADMQSHNGRYFANKARVIASPLAENPDMADQFYQQTKAFVNDILLSQGKPSL